MYSLGWTSRGASELALTRQPSGKPKGWEKCLAVDTWRVLEDRQGPGAPVNCRETSLEAFSKNHVCSPSMWDTEAEWRLRPAWGHSEKQSSKNRAEGKRRERVPSRLAMSTCQSQWLEYALS